MFFCRRQQAHINTRWASPPVARDSGH